MFKFKNLKYSFLMFLSSCFGFSEIKSKPGTTGTMDSTKTSTVSIYSFKVPTLTGDTLDLSTLKGKKILIVNTASKCGYTPQYTELEELHKKYGDKVVILGFPCNQFGGQEPGSSEEIGEFCKINYGVTFQIMEKVDVKGDAVAPVYKWLTDPALNGWNDQAPKWNFCKYLINEKGELIKFYASAVKPMDKEITDQLK